MSWHEGQRALGKWILALGLWASGCGDGQAEGEEGQEAPALVAVTEGPLLYRGSFFGELSAKNREQIHAPTMTDVEFLTIDAVKPDGTQVKKGEVILSFVRGPLEDELRFKETDLAVAEAEYKRTEHDLDKERIGLELEVKRRKLAVQRAELFLVEGVNLISKLDLEKFRLDLEKTKLELKLSQQALDAFAKKRANALEVQRLRVDSEKRQVEEKRQNLSKMEIQAPSDGVVYGPYTRLNWARAKASPGTVCRPGDKLLELPDLSSYEVNLYVRQRDASLIQVGAPALVYPTAAPDKPIKAVVVGKGDFATTRNERLGTKSAEGNLKELVVTLALAEAPEYLRPGGTVRADLEVELSPKALLVPLSALQEDAGQTWAVQADGTRRPIEIGQTTLDLAEVKGGLKAGERVRLVAPSGKPGSPGRLPPAVEGLVPKEGAEGGGRRGKGGEGGKPAEGGKPEGGTPAEGGGRPSGGERPSGGGKPPGP
jgi:multidrug efflux pump subunit AcrA (membrane-fusion protein)